MRRERILSRPLLLLPLLLVVFAARPSAARKLPKSYLAFAGGAKILTADVTGDVINGRGTGHVELGIGAQIADPLLLEFTYGWEGTFIQSPPVYPLPDSLPPPPDTERAFEVALNPLLLRLRYAASGMRTGYLKPEWSFGLGWTQVTRFLRNYPGFDAEETSQMLATVELGGSMLVVFSKNFMGSLSARYTFTERRDIVDETQHLDGLVLLLSFRTFLASPNDPEP